MITTIITLATALIASIIAFFFQKNKTEDVQAENNNLKTHEEISTFTQDIADNEKKIEQDGADEQQIKDGIKKSEILQSSTDALVDFFNKHDK